MPDERRIRQEEQRFGDQRAEGRDREAGDLAVEGGTAQRRIDCSTLPARNCAALLRVGATA